MKKAAPNKGGQEVTGSSRANDAFSNLVLLQSQTVVYHDTVVTDLSHEVPIYGDTQERVAMPGHPLLYLFAVKKIKKRYIA